MSLFRRALGFVVFLNAFFSIAQGAVVLTTAGEEIRMRFFLDGIETEIEANIINSLGTRTRLSLAQALVKELVRSGRYKDVVVERVPQTEAQSGTSRGEVWHVQLAAQRTIYDISISGISFLDESKYVRGLKSKVGLLFLEQYVEEDIARLTRQLQESGYPQAQVKSVQIKGVANGTVRIDFQVERKEACRLAEVRVEGTDSVFEIVSLPIELGSICNIPNLRKSLTLEEERLRSEGYLQAKVVLKSVTYSEDKTRALIMVEAFRGPRTRVGTLDLATGEVNEDFLTDEGGLSAFDLSLLSEEDLRREVLNRYLEDGYAQTTVTGPSYVNLNSGDRILRFFVQKGPRITVGEVEFVGDKLPVSRSDALDAMGLSPGILSQSIPFVEKNMAEYRESLQRLLLSEGFGDAVVDLPKVAISRSGGTAKLVFPFRLNKRYIMTEISILGRPEGFEIDTDEVNDIVDLDEPLSSQDISEMRETVRRQLIERGYYYAKVTEDVVLQNEGKDQRNVLLVLEIRAGPLVRVGNIYTEGELYGKSERVKLVSGLKKGDLFSPLLLEKARLRILRHDLFGSISVEAFDQSAIERREAELDVVIRTTGRSGYTLALSPGYGTRNGYRFGTEFVWNELNESGTRFNVNTSISQDRQQVPIARASQVIGRKITLGLTEPLLRVGNWVSPFDARILFGLEVSNQSFETRLFETYEISLIWRPTLLGLDFDLESGFAHEWSRVLSTRIEPLEAINNPSLQIHEIFVKLGFDSRDSVEWARKGMLHEVQSQHSRFGLDSDVAFDRYTLSSNFFFPIFTRWSSAVSLGYLTVSDVVNRKQATVTAPGSRRAGLTGRGIVRGFPERGRVLGPLVWLDLVSPEGGVAGGCENAVRSIGATNVLYAKHELRYRTTYLSDMLGVAWFVDTGTAFFTGSELRQIQSKIEENIANSTTSEGECAVLDAQVYQPAPVDIRNENVLQNYWDSAFVSSGLGLRFIVPNFASISFDWGLPLIDPATRNGESCESISTVEAGQSAPTCIKRDRQERLFGAIPVPGAFHIGIGATL